MGKRLFAPPPRADAWFEAEFHKALAAASDPISLIWAPAQETGGRSIEGTFCQGIVSFGNGPRRVSPDIVDYAKGGIFSRPRPSFDRSSGSALVAGSWRKQTWARCPPPSSRASCTRGAEINSAGGYLRGLTRKSEVGDFSLGPILMAQINSRRWDKKRA